MKELSYKLISLKEAKKIKCTQEKELRNPHRPCGWSDDDYSSDSDYYSSDDDIYSDEFIKIELNEDIPIVIKNELFSVNRLIATMRSCLRFHELEHFLVLSRVFQEVYKHNGYLIINYS
jgi:hypothetical protein